MSEVIIQWGKKEEPPKDEMDRIIKEIEEKSRNCNAFFISIDMSMVTWLESVIDNGTIKRSYSGSGDKIDIVIGVDEESAQKLVDRMR